MLFIFSLLIAWVFRPQPDNRKNKGLSAVPGLIEIPEPKQVLESFEVFPDSRGGRLPNRKFVKG
jgi:hypothetical protein